MTYNNIYEYFKDDDKLMDYYNPLGKAIDNKEAAMEIYHELINHSKEKKCHFIRSDMGYIFYSGHQLISFCVKPEYRNKENLEKFGNIIKKLLGKHFECGLFKKNTRAINFLKHIGMKEKKSTELITLLYI